MNEVDGWRKRLLENNRKLKRWMFFKDSFLKWPNGWDGKLGINLVWVKIIIKILTKIHICIPCLCFFFAYLQLYVLNKKKYISYFNKWLIGPGFIWANLLITLWLLFILTNAQVRLYPLVIINGRSQFCRLYSRPLTRTRFIFIEHMKSCIISFAYMFNLLPFMLPLVTCWELRLANELKKDHAIKLHKIIICWMEIMNRS